MLTNEQKLWIRQMRADGLPYERISDVTGYAAQTVRDAARDMQKPDGCKDTYAEDIEMRKLIRRIKRKAWHVQALRQKGALKPCEHCEWRMNQAPKPVCAVCYREALHTPAGSPECRSDCIREALHTPAGSPECRSDCIREVLR